MACEQAGYGFEAFAVEVFEVMAKIFCGLLGPIWTRLVRFGGCLTDRAVVTCLRQASISVQLGMARQNIACREVVLDEPHDAIPVNFKL